MKKVMAMALAMLLTMTCLPALADSLKDYTPLKDLSADNGFYMGAALSYNQMGDATYLTTVKHHFNTITTTNEMKAYSLLDQPPSRA